MKQTIAFFGLGRMGLPMAGHLLALGHEVRGVVKMKPFVLSQTFDAGFGLALMAKDLRTADELAHHVGFAAPLSRCCQALWTRASETLGPGADHTEIYRFLEQLPPDAE